MNDRVLVINCGSSSLKLAVFDQNDATLASALAERLGANNASATLRYGNEKQTLPLTPGAGHAAALNEIIHVLGERNILNETPAAIGHRVVHGGEAFKGAARITTEVLQAIEACCNLAPLHNPVNLLGIQATRTLFPDVPQVAVFDTAFHQTLPLHAYLYALPKRFYEDWGVRRYGFHGTSHAFMLEETAHRLGKPVAKTSLVSAHLGNGCSITAIRNGASVDTSMGLTPLEGLVMGTRSGDIDPGLFDFLADKDISAERLHRILNNESGLLGLSGLTNDMRTLIEAADNGHADAQTALDVFCFRLARYIGSMMVSLDHLDALVFTGGIGENSARVREETLKHLSLLGFALDYERNQGHGTQSTPLGSIESQGSRFRVMVIPTNEERVIAREALKYAR